MLHFKQLFLKTLIISVIMNLFIGFVYAGNHEIKGQVLSSDSKKPIKFANIIVKNSTIGCATDENGNFTIKINRFPIALLISHISYESKEIFIKSDEIITINLKEKMIRAEEVIVSAIRAIEGKTPIAFSTLTVDEIKTRYTVEDVPMILAMEPGVYAYSESGNGTGYSYVSIRGFDQSRIAVMLDNVPLNDNESHQVYWVDHGDILSDAKDVQIQRGIGNSLYGAAAFGGSINILTQIAKTEPQLSFTAGHGSYNTSKYSIKMNTGQKLGDNLSLTARVSRITTDGYREYHGSEQNGFFFGIEHRTPKISNQFRALIGYENANLAWDGVSSSDINNRKKRRESYKAYTDDFLQQIYSLNTIYKIKSNIIFRNVSYLVKGKGYYETQKQGQNFYSYNLDINNQYPDSTEKNMETDLLRRKWLNNQYFGIIPTLTLKQDRYRLDIGAEFRSYRGDHFGKVTNFSDTNLVNHFGNDWYEYYDYTGKKLSSTFFLHFAYFISNKLSFFTDFQYQKHHWTLEQDRIGHAAGHSLSAYWDFQNPRFGIMYNMNDHISLFVNYGKSSKEPADNQIIKADDVFSEPVKAAAEVIDDYEAGLQFQFHKIAVKTNFYRINYDNEQLKNIDIEQEGEYEYFSGDATIHQGFEISIKYEPGNNFSAFMNNSISQNIFTTGEFKDNVLPTTPSFLLNVGANYSLSENLVLFSNFRYVGKQYLDIANAGKIESYSVIDFGAKYQWKKVEITAKINNLFDTLYSTFGYGYEYNGYNAFYWPGATRNMFVAVSYSL